MRRVLLIAGLLCLSWYGFAQQNLPAKITGGIPPQNSTKKYVIQVGAYNHAENAEQARLRLRGNGLHPVSEPYRDLIRVMIPGIPAHQVTNFLVVLKRAGFNEVVIREETATRAEPVKAAVTGDTAFSMAEKWEVTVPAHDFESFEFNDDMNYVAIRKDGDARFGGYSMPDKDTINMDNLGAITIISNDGGIRFMFTPLDEPEKKIILAAVKTEAMPPSAELDLFCRTWKIVNCADPDTIGLYLFISNAGTYFFTTPDGESHNLASWRWYDDDRQEFEYSHDNWEHYGRTKITSLSLHSLEFLDPGYLKTVEGYSSAGAEDHYELVPVQD